MNEEGNNEQKGKTSKLHVVKEIVEAVPVYQDLAQPAAKEIGKSLQTVAKTVNIALAPVSVLVWGYDTIKEFISKRVSEKLKNIPQENIVTPPPEVAGPAIEALRFSGQNEQLREMYANLLATSMNKDTTNKTHPSFVEIIKNLTSDEAQVLKCFEKENSFPAIDIRGHEKGKSDFVEYYQNYSHLYKIYPLKNEQLLPSYLINLERLGLIGINEYYFTGNVYDPLKTDDFHLNLRKMITNDLNKEVEFHKKIIAITDFGKQFIEAVVKEKY